MSLHTGNLHPRTISAAVSCRDFARRRRSVVITQLSDTRLMITVPAGEIAMLGTRHAVLELREVLRKAVFNAAGIALPDANTIFQAAAINGRAQVDLRLQVHCHDGWERERAVSIRLTEAGNVILLAPAGGIAILDPLAVRRLRGALWHASAIARWPRRHPTDQLYWATAAENRPAA